MTLLMVEGAFLSSLRDYQGFVSPTTGWHPWLMTFMPSALSAQGATAQGLFRGNRSRRCPKGVWHVHG